jgi:hypothetical protein
MVLVLRVCGPLALVRRGADSPRIAGIRMAAWTVLEVFCSHSTGRARENLSADAAHG